MVVKYDYLVTQPATLLAVAVILIGGAFIAPTELKGGGLSAWLRLAHLTAFSVWLGAQVWVTFFAGLVMFRILTRKAFSAVQSILFPKYFTLGTVLTSIAIMTFVMEHPVDTWNTRLKIQLSCLGVCLVVTAVNLVYVGPQGFLVQQKKLKIEEEEKADECVGKVDTDKLQILEKNHDYVALSKRFRVLHTVSTINNLIGIGSSVLYAWYLAANLKTI